MVLEMIAMAAVKALLLLERAPHIFAHQPPVLPARVSGSIRESLSRLARLGGARYAVGGAGALRGSRRGQRTPGTP